MGENKKTVIMISLFLMLVFIALLQAVFTLDKTQKNLISCEKELNYTTQNRDAFCEYAAMAVMQYENVYLNCTYVSEQGYQDFQRWTDEDRTK